MKSSPMSTLRIIQDLYDSEINMSIVSVWDSGYEVKLGDAFNGFVAHKDCSNIIEAASFLFSAALDHFPESSFAKKYGKQAKEDSP